MHSAEDAAMLALVIGRSGQVATALARLGQAAGHDVRCLGRGEIDILNRGDVAAVVRQFNPDAIVNGAAYTAVDKAESDRNAAFDLNMRAPQLLAGVAADQAVPFIHMSTDYVFDGTKPAPYDPGDPVCPINIYGESKAAGEAAVRAANPSAVIIRTSWVYSETGVNFVKRMLELGAERDELRIVDDQIGNPTFADDIAQACFAIASHDDMRQGATGGIYHAAGRGDVTWHGFARAIFDEAGKRGARVPTHVIPITTDQYPTQARRPKNSRLDCTSAEATFDIILKPWQNGLKTCINRLLAGGKP
jgi:dTDP-4-dehydrorhamnose reductase